MRPKLWAQNDFDNNVQDVRKWHICVWFTIETKSNNPAVSKLFAFSANLFFGLTHGFAPCEWRQKTAHKSHLTKRCNLGQTTRTHLNMNKIVTWNRLTNSSIRPFDVIWLKSPCGHKTIQICQTKYRHFRSILLLSLVSFCLLFNNHLLLHNKPNL